MITIIVPVYNEEKILEKSIKKLDKYMRKRYKDYRIVISDNASTDKTPVIAKKLENEHIKYLRLKQKGKGLAIMEAAKKFKSDIYGFIDADLPTDLKNIDKAIKLLEKYDLVVGYRKNLRAPLRRRITSRMYKYIANVILFGNPFKVKDFQAGFKFWRNINIEGLDKEFFFDTTLIYRAIRQGKKIYYLPINYRIDKEGKVKVFKTSLNFFLKLLELRKGMEIFLVIIATLFSSTGNLLFKIASPLIQGELTILNLIVFGIGLISLFIGFIAFYLALRMGELSRIHPSMALNFIWINLFAYLFLKESFSLTKIIAIASIITGVYLLNREVKK